MRNLFFVFLFIFSQLIYLPAVKAEKADNSEYTVGVDDVLEINILQPEKLTTTAAVSSDGSVSFPYIGNVPVKGLSLSKIQNEIQSRLSDGYMKYPLVTVLLKESRSRKFFVYGDVTKPGAYLMESDTTVLKAISIAGGFTKHGSSSRVKLLRPKKNGVGYETIEVNIRAVMQGSADADIILNPADTVIVSESKFYVYGEVNKPGVYPMEEDITVLKAIAIAGGFTKYGSSSRVKLLRPKENGVGYETRKINIKEIMDGSSDTDIILKPGDTIVVFEGLI